MKKQNNRETTFPIDLRLESRADKVLVYGMSLRDYFAASALQGLLSNKEGYDRSWAFASKEAYQYADEMLAARKEAQP